MNRVPTPRFSVKDVAKSLTNPITPTDLTDLENEEKAFKSVVLTPKSVNMTTHTTNLSSVDLEKLYSKDFAMHVKPKVFYNKIVESSTYCPYCGVSTPTEVDHYLPKNKYQALSITPINLMPICSKCNKTKSEKDPSQSNHFFINPYYDNMPGWLSFDLIVNNGNVSFRIKPMSKSVANYDKILFTIKSLKLQRRIEWRATMIFHDKRGILSNVKSKGPERLKNFLNDNYLPSKINDIENEVFRCLYLNFSTINSLL